MAETQPSNITPMPKRYNTTGKICPFGGILGVEPVGKIAAPVQGVQTTGNVRIHRQPCWENQCAFFDVEFGCVIFAMCKSFAVLEDHDEV